MEVVSREALLVQFVPTSLHRLITEAVPDCDRGLSFESSGFRARCLIQVGIPQIENNKKHNSEIYYGSRRCILLFVLFLCAFSFFRPGFFSLHNFGFGGLDTGRDKILKIGNNQFENLVYGHRFNSDPLHLNHSSGRQRTPSHALHTLLEVPPRSLSLSLSLSPSLRECCHRL